MSKWFDSVRRPTVHWMPSSFQGRSRQSKHCASCVSEVSIVLRIACWPQAERWAAFAAAINCWARSFATLNV